jgi:hypothetical protein
MKDDDPNLPFVKKIRRGDVVEIVARFRNITLDQKGNAWSEYGTRAESQLTLEGKWSPELGDIVSARIVDNELEAMARADLHDIGWSDSDIDRLFCVALSPEGPTDPGEE